MPEELKQMYADLQTAWGQMKSVLERQDAAIAQFGDAPQELKNMVDALNGRIDELETKAQRFDPRGVSSAAGEVVRGENHGLIKVATDLETKAFSSYMRMGEKGLGPDEFKALSTDSDPDGGFMLPQNRSNEIIKYLKQVSPIRELASVQTISVGDSFEIPREDSTTEPGTGWVSERETRSTTDTPKLGMLKIFVHEMYANPRVTQKLLDDIAFNAEGWLNERVGTRFAQIEGDAFINGNGEGKPMGILSKSGITNTNSGAATTIGTTGDKLVDMFYGLASPYARDAIWLMKRATMGSIRKLKDGQGQYLWQPGLQPGDAATILGRPYREAVDMPAEGAGNKVIILGDFKKAYQIVDRQGIRVLRNPYTAIPFVEFYSTIRVGGDVVLTEALRTMTCSA